MNEGHVRKSALITNAEDWVTLAITRSLGRKGVKVTAASHLAKAMTFHSRYCTRRAYYPDTRFAGEKSVVDHLLGYLRKNRHDVFIPGQENIVIPVSKREDEFRRYVNLPFADADTIDITDDKSRTYRAAIKAGVGIPRTLFMEDLDNPESAVKDLEFPLLIKPYRGRGSIGQTVINVPKGLNEKFRKTVSVYGPSMIQEYIDFENRYSFSTLFDESHRPVRMCLLKEVRTYPLTGGPLVCSVAVRNDEITEAALKLFKYIKWYGIANSGFLIDRKDGRPKFIEINPRFFGSTPVVIGAGVDYPWLLYRMATGEKVKPDISYRIGHKGRHVFPEDIKYLIDVLRGGPNIKGRKNPDKLRALVDVLNPLQSNQTYYTFAADDPVPFLFDAGKFLYGKATKMMKRIV